MKFLVSAAGVLLMANAAFASPLSRRAAAPGRPIRRSGLNHPLGRNATSGLYAAEASSNWAGAAIVTTGVTEVVGTFTIPQPSPPSGGSTRTAYCGAAWAGIDGDTCQSGLIQTGVFWCVEDGEYSYEAWYEYLDAASVAYSDITVTSGDEITVTVTKTSDTGGITTLENVSTGVTVTHTFTDQTDGTLCGDNAEWIVEDYFEGDSLVPFADFGTVTFTGCEATVDGSTVTPGSEGDATTNIYLESSSGATLTSTTIDGSTVTVTYE